MLTRFLLLISGLTLTSLLLYFYQALPGTQEPRPARHRTKTSASPKQTVQFDLPGEPCAPNNLGHEGLHRRATVHR